MSHLSIDSAASIVASRRNNSRILSSTVQNSPNSVVDLFDWPIMDAPVPVPVPPVSISSRSKEDDCCCSRNDAAFADRCVLIK